jgi:hypothetical protein
MIYMINVSLSNKSKSRYAKMGKEVKTTYETVSLVVARVDIVVQYFISGVAYTFMTPVVSKHRGILVEWKRLYLVYTFTENRGRISPAF